MSNAKRACEDSFNLDNRHILQISRFEDRGAPVGVCIFPFYKIWESDPTKKIKMTFYMDDGDIFQKIIQNGWASDEFTKLRLRAFLKRFFCVY